MNKMFGDKKTDIIIKIEERHRENKKTYKIIRIRRI